MSIYFSLQAEIVNPAWRLVAVMASQAFICRADHWLLFFLAFSWISDASLHTSWPWKRLLWLNNRENREVVVVNHITLHTTLYISIFIEWSTFDAVDFWCLLLILVETSHVHVPYLTILLLDAGSTQFYKLDLFYSYLCCWKWEKVACWIVNVGAEFKSAFGCICLF